MQYIPSEKNPSGAYKGPRSNPEPGAYAITDEQATMLVEHNGFVDITPNNDGTIVMSVNAEAWAAWQAEHPPTDPVEQLASEVRDKRDELLTASDKYVTMDAPIAADTRAAMYKYRQELRDIPEQDGFPEAVIWPELPEIIKAAPDPVDEAMDVLLGGDDNA